MSPEEAHAETCQHVSETTWQEPSFSLVVSFWMQRKRCRRERWNMFAPGLCWKSRRTCVRCIFSSLLWSLRELIFKHTGPIGNGGWCTKLICIMFPLVLEHSWCKSALMMHSGLSENHYQGWVLFFCLWRIPHKHFMFNAPESWFEFANCTLFLGIRLRLLFTTQEPACSQRGRGGNTSDNKPPWS